MSSSLSSVLNPASIVTPPSETAPLVSSRDAVIAEVAHLRLGDLDAELGETMLTLKDKQFLEEIKNSSLKITNFYDISMGKEEFTTLNYALTDRVNRGDSEAMLALGLIKRNTLIWHHWPENSGLDEKVNLENKEESVRLFTRSASLGNHQAMKWLGSCYEGGQGVAVDLGRAVCLYRHAAALGNVDVLSELVRCYALGVGVTADNSQAAFFAEKGARLGDKEAMFQYAAICEDRKDLAQAIYWLRQAADAGCDRARVRLGLFYREGREGLPSDHVESARLFRLAAEQGNTDAWVHLGTCYRNGWGVPKDEKIAATLYLVAVDFGHGGGAYRLAGMYEQGLGVRQNYKVAVYYLIKTVKLRGKEQGIAAYGLGKYYKLGKGVSQNDVKAAEWFRKAADLKESRALCDLGVCYLKGEGVHRDPVEAAKLFQAGSEKGDSRAMHNLSVLYSTGVGVSKDVGTALALARQANEIERHAH